MRTFFGVILALLAVTTGGCSLLFSNMIYNFDDFVTIWGLGGIPAVICGYSAWRLLRRAKPEEGPK